jgi:hypothetical protein
MPKIPPSDLVPYTGDASLLARCLRMQLERGAPRAVAEWEAFKVACCRPFDPDNETDARHMADAWALIDSTTTKGP